MLNKVLLQKIAKPTNIPAINKVMQMVKFRFTSVQLDFVKNFNCQ